MGQVDRRRGGVDFERGGASWRPTRPEGAETTAPGQEFLQILAAAVAVFIVAVSFAVMAHDAARDRSDRAAPPARLGVFGETSPAPDAATRIVERSRTRIYCLVCPAGNGA